MHTLIHDALACIQESMCTEMHKVPVYRHTTHAHTTHIHTTHVFTHEHTHACTHARTHAHKHTTTHTRPPSLPHPRSSTHINTMHVCTNPGYTPCYKYNTHDTALTMRLAFFSSFLRFSSARIWALLNANSFTSSSLKGHWEGRPGSCEK